MNSSGSVIDEIKSITLTIDLLISIRTRLLTNLNGGQLEIIWQDLPSTVQNQFKQHLPCYKHYNTKDMITHIDGPAPSIFRCAECNK